MSGWDATLELSFARRRERTTMVRRLHQGPLMVQSPFYPGDGTCHVYVLHPPGGIAGGDRLHTRLTTAPGAQVLTTTPAASKFYRTTGPAGEQHQRIEVDANGSFEWVPQESLVFDGARARSTTQVELSPSARFFGWETWALGRPARGEHFSHGSIDQTLDVRIGGSPVLIERMRMGAADDFKDAPWGLGGHCAFTTAYAYPADVGTLDLVRHFLEQAEEVATAGATLLGKLLVVRGLGTGTRTLISWQRALWALLRPSVLGLDACPPRVWAT